MKFQENAQADRRADGRMEGRKDKQTLFNRTLPATTRGPKEHN